MYLLAFFTVLGIITYITNKQNEVESSPEFLYWTLKDIYVIAGVFFIAVVLQIIAKFIPWFIIIIYCVVAATALLLVNKNREQYIIVYKNQVSQILEALGKLSPMKTKDEIDYNDLPFKLERDLHGNISRIVVTMKEPNKFNDSNCTATVYTLKRFFPHCDWKFTCDFPKQQCVFEGMKLPPKIANWMGSDLRGSNFVPLGVSGSNEVGWNLANRQHGISNFVWEDGERAEEIELPTAPQMITVGSTGGGKNIYLYQKIW